MLEGWGASLPCLQNCRHLTLQGGFPDSGFQTDFPSGGFQTGQDPFFDSNCSTGLKYCITVFGPLHPLSLVRNSAVHTCFSRNGWNTSGGISACFDWMPLRKTSSCCWICGGAPRIGTTNLFPLPPPLLFRGGSQCLASQCEVCYRIILVSGFFRNLHRALWQ